MRACQFTAPVLPDGVDVALCAVVAAELLYAPFPKDGNGTPPELANFTSLATARVRVKDVASGAHAYFPLHYDARHFATSQLVLHAAVIGCRLQDVPTHKPPPSSITRSLSSSRLKLLPSQALQKRAQACVCACRRHFSHGVSTAR